MARFNASARISYTAVVNRLHKVMTGVELTLLEDGNIKLSAVISDVIGVSGRRTLGALASGESDPEVLSALGDPRLRATSEVLQENLLGEVSAHHRFMLETLLEQIPGHLLMPRCTRWLISHRPSYTCL